MRWLLSFVFCLTAAAQLPVVPFNPTPAASTWYPTNAAQQLLYWFDVLPNPSQNGVRNAVNGTGSIPTDGSSAFSWTNWSHPFLTTEGQYGNATDSAHRPIYKASGGGVSGTAPRVNFNNGGGSGCGFSVNPYTSITITNFTVVMVLNMSNCAAANTGIIVCSGFGLNYPFLDVSSSALRIGSLNGSKTVTGPATIQNIPYIISWIQAGASSRIDTNGVQYVAGDAGTGGINSSGAPQLVNPTASGSPAHTTQYIGDISRFWMWTNTLSAGDLSSAVAQCKKDFGFP